MIMINLASMIMINLGLNDHDQLGLRFFLWCVYTDQDEVQEVDPLKIEFHGIGIGI